MPPVAKDNRPGGKRGDRDSKGGVGLLVGGYHRLSLCSVGGGGERHSGGFEEKFGRGTMPKLVSIPSCMIYTGCERKSLYGYPLFLAMVPAKTLFHTLY